MDTVTLVFPHQLYKKHPALRNGSKVFLVEEWLYFNQYQFHKHKLVLHRASMKYYQHFLIEQGFIVAYIEANEDNSDVRNLIELLARQQVKTVRYCDVTDDWLGRRLNFQCVKCNVEQVRFPSPNFLNTLPDADEFFNNKKTYFQTDFYIWQRKLRNILIEADGQPIGGKWTFDSENRERFPRHEAAPEITFPKENEYVKEAKNYVEKYWSSNYGDTSHFHYPVNFSESDNWLKQFMESRFTKFGVYEDSMVVNENILYHSVLTPMLNIGLLTPGEIISKALDYASSNEIPINSLEGFIRQIMGWREFIRIVYEREGRRQRTQNYWGFTRKIPHSFWRGETGIAPVDIVIKKTLECGYTHHIERLMVLGNFMLLCEFDPGEVYRWFMEMYVDAYDWVMVPNVYGMTQFADGGLMTTKPYISGSNYLMKMGDWPKGEWQQVWDGLFWRFMHVHRRFFLKNPRLGMLIKTFDNMDAEKRNRHLVNAEKFLGSL